MRLQSFIRNTACHLPGGPPVNVPSTHSCIRLTHLLDYSAIDWGRRPCPPVEYFQKLLTCAPVVTRQITHYVGEGVYRPCDLPNYWADFKIKMPFDGPAGV